MSKKFVILRTHVFWSSSQAYRHQCCSPKCQYHNYVLEKHSNITIHHCAKTCLVITCKNLLQSVISIILKLLHCSTLIHFTQCFPFIVETQNLLPYVSHHIPFHLHLQTAIAVMFPALSPPFLLHLLHFSNYVMFILLQHKTTTTAINLLYAIM